LISRLGGGGMSTVYLARHALIDRLAAIKVLHEDLARHAEHKERFLREARAVNRINHPNIVEISDYGEAELRIGSRGGRRVVVYLVMEYVPGESLAKLLLRGPLPETRLVPIAMQVASALARAHQTGVIHRDVKPENVLLVARRDWVDLVKLTDFGVAKMTHVARADSADAQVVGTPGWIAPEYLLGEAQIDGRADLWSLGVLMYEAMCGRLPFDANDPAELLTRALTDAPTPLRQKNSDVSQPVADVVMRCLRPRPDDRPRDAWALIEELRVAAPWAKRIVTENPSVPAMPAVSIEAAAQQGGESAALLDGVSMPRWNDTPIGKLAQAWREYHAAIDRAESAKREDPPDAIAASFARRRAALDALETVASRIVSRQQEIEVLTSRGRDFRSTLGKAIDTLAYDLSRAHAHVQLLKNRRVDLHLRRRRADDPGSADALLWEEATVDNEMRKAQDVVSDLGYQVATLQDELFKRNNVHETEVLHMTGVLEGEVAAAGTLHREIEMLSRELHDYVRRA
jgi:serine/threonine-protein kinase